MSLSLLVGRRVAQYTGFIQASTKFQGLLKESLVFKLYELIMGYISKFNFRNASLRLWINKYDKISKHVELLPIYLMQHILP